MRPSAGFVASHVLVVSVVAACGSIPPEGGDCGGVYDGGCGQMMDEIAERWPGQVRRIDLKCTLASCDRVRGVGTARVTFGDGRTTAVPWSYAGDPVPAPDCSGLGELLCQTVQAGVVEGLPPSPSVRAMRITCIGECAWSGGETRVDMVYADGTTARTGYGWEGGFVLPSGYSSLPREEAGPFRAPAPAPSSP